MRYEFENLRHFESALLQQQAAGEAAVVCFLLPQTSQDD